MLQHIQKITTIIIPVHNEQENIGQLIEEIKNLYPEIHICVVNDGSNDTTAEILRKISGIQVISNIKNFGLISAITQGIQEIGTEYLIVMDGDFQHPVQEIHRFLEMFQKHPELDICIAQRNNISFKKFGYRVLVSRCGIFLCQLRLRSTFIKDPLSGFFGGKTIFLKEQIHRLKTDGKGYKFLFEVLKNTLGRAKIQTFEYIFQKRKNGYSKLNVWVHLRFIYSLFR